MDRVGKKDVAHKAIAALLAAGQADAAKLLMAMWKNRLSRRRNERLALQMDTDEGKRTDGREHGGTKDE